MNSSEFLKLVEEYPFPWRFEHYGEPLDYERDVSDDGPLPLLPSEVCYALCDAAPAMAKEIIKLLREVERAETGAVFDMEVAISGLRESLPESLRK